jgi:hypothetical protein
MNQGSPCAALMLVFKVPPQGFEPRTNRLCLPLRLSPRSVPNCLQSLWSGLSLRFTRLPLSLYTFHAPRCGMAWLGITISAFAA